MPFSAKKEITINRSTQSGVGLPSEVSVIDALFKVTAITVTGASVTATVMVSYDSGYTYNFYGNEPVSIDGLDVELLTLAEKKLCNENTENIFIDSSVVK
ncbi:TPA: hypothetical protein MDH88_004436 [Klebsiella pneumoniae]|uniref:hypothetical protein n=1 Tax=Klebsiella pneumoniae complex TaxID=3390273 RepID=UPI0008FAEF8C|nr:hypothetical protein [Klebsiella pneumoniae]ARS98719.1 hypothetical protein B8O09_05840 [Klebsiella pneumoniae]ASC25406.1 hypothetical protein AM386_28220 [Klebsiella pneumoniae]OKN54552.1 hypothetical protein AM420_002587 [Klebsiella pneumoniae]UMD25404.1 hypothetical protein JJ672_10020 [Klebsiella pneumoniae]UYF66978.1 hypothetical protein NW302_23095 [Klebsiella pneumoniae]